MEKGTSYEFASTLTKLLGLLTVYQTRISLMSMSVTKILNDMEKSKEITKSEDEFMKTIGDVLGFIKARQEQVVQEVTAVADTLKKFSDAIYEIAEVLKESNVKDV